MTVVRSLLVGSLALLLSSCSKDATPNGKSQTEPPVEAFGHMGEWSIGNADSRFAIKFPFLQLGDRQVVCGLAEYPGKPRQPAFVLLLKRTSKSYFVVDGGVSTKEGKTYWDQRFPTTEGQTHAVKFEITHQPVTERFIVGDQTYSLDAGRVFLVDLAAQPVQVTQIKADVRELLPDREPSREDLKAIVEKLRAKHESVRTFW